MSVGHIPRDESRRSGSFVNFQVQHEDVIWHGSCEDCFVQYTMCGQLSAYSQYNPSGSQTKQRTPNRSM